MQRLYFQNTLTKSLDEFRPLEAGRVRLYTCGPTVYSRQHLGNLRAYVFSDLLRRTLQHFGYAVRHVINVTDVGHLTDDADFGDDKMEQAARERGQNAREIAERIFHAFRVDLERINVLAPDVFCKATEHIPEQIALIERLEARGFTYRLDDGIYFDTSRDPHYGALSRTSAERSRSRVASAGGKRHPADFALWKFSPTTGPPRQLEWPSPWGTGFPGWHIECSAMSIRYLGERFDIHTGGIDHVPVHHTNEIAQSESALGVHPWVNYWLHGGWLLSDGHKISKSIGGVPSLDDLVAWGFEPDAFRYYLYTAHYRAPLALDLEALRAAQAAWQRLKLVVGPDDVRTESAASGSGARLARVRELEQAFDRALARDLDAPRALSVIWHAYRDAELPPAERARLIGRFASTLGLTLKEQYSADQASSAPESADIQALVRAREQARVDKDFARADAIRAELAERRVAVADTPQGPTWRRTT